ncbi:Uncharacterized protein APZ42_014523 [Daphnia magna]|uniref:Uncharacterized protein n=1 Tax=Daphnia magna TaxID=35525 RepID=A0A162PUQ1_9CRUS|nr:Uncharacterized protein APZ42_014523 [Daphnia magna]
MYYSVSSSPANNQYKGVPFGNSMKAFRKQHRRASCARCIS